MDPIIASAILVLPLGSMRPVPSFPSHFVAEAEVALPRQPGVADACDERLAKDVEGLAIPYSKRLDEPDPCCEGQFKEKVSAAVPTVMLVEYSVGDRVDVLRKSTPWLLAWPATDRRVRIQGRHKDLSKQYQIDAAKDPTASSAGPTEGRFRWNTDRAATLYSAADEILFAVWTTSRGLSGPDVERWDSLTESTPVYLPLRIESSLGADPQPTVVGDRPAAEQPASAPPSAAERCRLNLTANVQLDDLRIEAVRDDDGPHKPVVLEKSTSIGTRSKVVYLKGFEFDGGLVRLDIYKHPSGKPPTKINSLYLRLPGPKIAPPRPEAPAAPIATPEVGH